MAQTPTTESCPGSVDEELTPTDLAVNQSRYRRRHKRGKVVLFTPWRWLMGFVADLTRPVPYGRHEREFLLCALLKAGKLGSGQGCRPTEAMFWGASSRVAQDGKRVSAGISAAMGVCRDTVARAAARLRDLGLLRWVIVRQCQRLPSANGAGEAFTGPRARSPVRIYYVEVGNVRTLFGLGPCPARGPVPQAHRGPVVRTATPAISAENTYGHCAPDGLAPHGAVVNFNFNHRSEPARARRAAAPGAPNTARPPPESVVVECTESGERIFAHWVSALAVPHLGSEPRGQLAWSARQAIERALVAPAPGVAPYTEDDLHAAIAAAASRELGGRGHDYVEAEGIWDDRLFVGRPIGILLGHYSAAQNAKAKRRAALAARSADCDPAATPLATPAQTAEFARQALAAVRSRAAPPTELTAADRRLLRDALLEAESAVVPVAPKVAR